jgi:2-amino-4-hydroxy-6-hydroxymethyldihydropteridine diphosphokinase
MTSSAPLPAHAPWQRAYVGLGANLGDALATLAAARDAIAAWPHSRLVASSSPYRSAPVDAVGPDFVNAVLAIDTTLDGPALLAALQALERRFGRQRPFHHAPRTLDLDLLLLGDTVSHTAELQLPHPRLHLRAFVLKPLLELAPALALPGLGPLAGWLPAVAQQALQRLDGWPGPTPAATYNPPATN